MALIKCRECKKEVSSEAKLCPHCGCRVKEKKKLSKSDKKMICELVAIGVLILCAIAFGIYMGEQSKKKIDKSISDVFFSSGGTTLDDFRDDLENQMDDLVPN